MIPVDIPHIPQKLIDCINCDDDVHIIEDVAQDIIKIIRTTEHWPGKSLGGHISDIIENIREYMKEQTS